MANPRVTKLCSKCGVEGEHYTVTRRGSFVPGGHCIQCTKARTKAWNAAHKERVQAARSRYEHSSKGRDRTRRRTDRSESGKRYREKHPERLRAKSAVRRALAGGRLQRSTSCQACGGPPTPHGSNAYGLVAHHHAGYAQENWLVVAWVCVPCHKRAHGAYVRTDPNTTDWVTWEQAQGKRRRKQRGREMVLRKNVREDRARSRGLAAASQAAWDQKKAEANRVDSAV